MLLEVAGTRMVPPFEPLAYRAAEACGRLPLVLAVAGGILAEAGGRLSEEYLSLLRGAPGAAEEHHFQLTGTPLPATLREESEVFAALQAAAGRRRQTAAPY